MANVAHFTASKHLGLICTAIFQSIEIKSEAGRVLVIELNFDAKLSPRKISLLFIPVVGFSFYLDINQC